MKTAAVVLAAGLGTRMKSSTIKAVHAVAGVPMVVHVVAAARAAGCDPVIVVVGHQREMVQDALAGQDPGVLYAYQEEQLGTGHAARQAEGLLAGFDGQVVILYGDTPLLRPETIGELAAARDRSGAAAAMLTAVLPDPAGYGRVIRDASGEVERIVEHKDATAEQRQIREINTGLYAFDAKRLFAALQQVKNDNLQREYYLPDVIPILRGEGHEVVAVAMEGDPFEALGINTRRQLADADRIMRRRTVDRWLDAGVTIVDPDRTFIEAAATIGPDTVIWPDCYLRGRTQIGAGCVIGPSSDIVDSIVGDGARVVRSVVEGSEIGSGTDVGPYSHLRQGTKIGAGVHIGNFVELKKAEVHEGSKVGHHSYLGDVTIGSRTNIGAGVVVVNYDGIDKHHSELGQESFIGCNVNLVSPVKVGDGAYVAAGSTITRDVPPGSLAVARERNQVNIEGWVERRQRRRAKEENDR